MCGAETVPVSHTALGRCVVGNVQHSDEPRTRHAVACIRIYPIYIFIYLFFVRIDSIS